MASLRDNDSGSGSLKNKKQVDNWVEIYKNLNLYLYIEAENL